MDKEKEHIIADKTMLRVARVTSMVFTPFSIPFLSFLVLFLFSYLRIMPIQYKLIVLGIVYCFTILTPTITIFLFRKINGFARQELSERKKRYVPILLTIISYVFCLLMMRKLNIPWYMTGIILASLVVHLTAPVPVLSLFLTGFTEMTTGIALVGASSMHLPLRYLLSLTFASFGGLSCIAQTRGMLCGTPLSIRTYIAGKTVHGICTLLVGWLLLFVQTFQ